MHILKSRNATPTNGLQCQCAAPGFHLYDSEPDVMSRSFDTAGHTTWKASCQQRPKHCNICYGIELALDASAGKSDLVD